MRVTVVIPARYESTRFIGKATTLIAGKPMIRHVYERAARSPLVDRVVLATDDERILEVASDFGGEAIMTSSNVRCGTDRVAEAADKLGLPEEDLVVNIQGDQPCFNPVQIAEVTAPLVTDPELPMSTLIYRITDPSEIDDPNIVKTVFDRRGRALYFSRATIPHVRGGEGRIPYYKHHGIYGYRRHFLRTFAQWPTSAMEEAEKLEQLRALDYGAPIQVVITAFDSMEVDTPRDVAKVEEVFRNEAAL